ncbi:MAG: HEAT repeat domain-containing protein, partial [Candidatus Omnitrophica bacterium]|nr:HEAT repeat domain-containing protein [Candidatus Omnitrophota bacterium]
MKKSLLGEVYVGQKKLEGVNLADRNIKQTIYDRYLEGFKSGVYNYIKEEREEKTQQLIPRKYFAGGVTAVAGIGLDAASAGQAREAMAAAADSEVVRVALQPMANAEHEEGIDQGILQVAFDEDDFRALAQKIETVDDPVVQRVGGFLRRVSGTEGLMNTLQDLIEGRLPPATDGNPPQLDRVIYEAGLAARPVLGHASDRGIHIIMEQHSPRVEDTDGQAATLLHELVAFLGQEHPVSVAFELAFQAFVRNQDSPIQSILEHPTVQALFEARLATDGYNGPDGPSWTLSLAETFRRGVKNIQTYLAEHDGVREPFLLTRMKEREVAEGSGFAGPRRDYAVTQAIIVPQRISDLLSDLIGSLDDGDRFQAAVSLGSAKHPAAVSSLLRIVENERERWTLRSASMKALGQIGDPQMGPVLLEILRQKDPAQLSAAEEDFYKNLIKALGIIDFEEAIPTLREWMGDDQKPDLRFLAIVALGKLKASGIVPYLIEAGEGTQYWGQQFEVIECLVEIEEENGLRSLEKFLFNNRVDPRMLSGEVMDLIIEHAGHPMAMGILRKALVGHSNRFVRVKASGFLAEQSDYHAIPFLLRALEDPDSRVVDNAIDGLVRLGNEDTILALRRILGELKEDVTLFIFDDHGAMVQYSKPMVFVGMDSQD